MTTERTIRNMRPKVLAAVLRLETFTAQEIVSAAELENRKQAYAQLRPLEDAGWITSISIITPNLDHRPPKQYRVAIENGAVQELQKELSGYGFSSPSPQGEVKAFHAALERGAKALDLVEPRLKTFESAKLSGKRDLTRAASFVEDWSKQLDQVETELETAALESEAIPNSDREMAVVSHRLREARSSIQRMKGAIERRQLILWIQALVENWTDKITDPFPWACKLLKPAQGDLGVEVVLDQLSPGLHKPELMPALLTSQAIRTCDVGLIGSCYEHLWKQPGQELAWLDYDRANVNFLLGKYQKAFKQWHNVCSSINREETPLKRNYALGVFLCEPDHLKQSTLRPLLHKYEVSIVSPRMLDFWNWNEEVVRPLLVDPLSEVCHEAGPLKSTVALTDVGEDGPLWVLFAYGPLTAIIRQWPGAPPLRVAASIDKLTHVEIDTTRIANALRRQKCIVVLEKQGITDPSVFDVDIEAALGSVDRIFSAGADTECAR